MNRSNKFCRRILSVMGLKGGGGVGVGKATKRKWKEESRSRTKVVIVSVHVRLDICPPPPVNDSQGTPLVLSAACVTFSRSSHECTFTRKANPTLFRRRVEDSGWSYLDLLFCLLNACGAAGRVRVIGVYRNLIHHWCITFHWFALILF